MRALASYLEGRNTHWVLVLLAAVLFIPFLGQVHLFDWDEINFAECAREMIVTGDYFRPQINFQPFWEKPPLFIWMQVACMKLFGINEFAARLPNALTGVATVFLCSYIGRRVFNRRTGNLFALFFMITWLPHFYFKSGIIDPVFNLFIFLGFYQFYLAVREDKVFLHPVLAGLFIGLATLTKGPAALLIFGLAVLIFLLFFKGLSRISLLSLLTIGLAVILTVLCWFGIYFMLDGAWFIREFITYQLRLFSTRDAGHGGPFFYHFIVLLIGCFPAAAFLFQYRRKEYDGFRQFTFRAWMWIMFWVTLILFSIVKTKIVHYSSLCYFPLCFIAAQYVDEIMCNERIAERRTLLTFLLTGLLWALILIILPVVGLYKDVLIPYIKDPFAVANLQAEVQWNYWELIPGFIYLAAVIWLFVRFRKQLAAYFGWLVLLQLLVIPFVILHFTPKIEAISQRAAVEFYKGFAGQKVIIRTVDFKSYAHLFYASKPSGLPAYSPDWTDLLRMETKENVYLVTKIQNRTKLDTLPQLQLLREKNGFVFYVKKRQ